LLVGCKIRTFGSQKTKFGCGISIAFPERFCSCTPYLLISYCSDNRGVPFYEASCSLPSRCALRPFICGACLISNIVPFEDYQPLFLSFAQASRAIRQQGYSHFKKETFS